MKLRTPITAGLIVAAVVGMGAASVEAHHSTTMFDHSKVMTIKGTVVEFRWTNPHVSVMINATTKDGEEPTPWLLEMTSPGNLVRAGGWSRTALKPGDHVEAELSPLRDSTKHGGALKKITVVDTGQTFTADLRAQEEKPSSE
jgi:hypothetical protein